MIMPPCREGASANICDIVAHGHATPADGRSENEGDKATQPASVEAQAQSARQQSAGRLAHKSPQAKANLCGQLSVFCLTVRGEAGAQTCWVLCFSSSGSGEAITEFTCGLNLPGSDRARLASSVAAFAPEEVSRQWHSSSTIWQA